MGPNFANLFDRLLAITASAALIGLLVVVTSGIVSRAFGAPFIWTDEGASYLMVWLSMLSWMVATRRGVHIRVKSLFNMLPLQSQTLAETIFLLLITVLGVIVAWQGAKLAATNSDVEAITLPIATSWLYLPLIPAGLMMAAQAALDLAALRRSNGTLDIQDRSAPL